MATPPARAARDHGHYQQRVWKVSKQLDRLALLCEQHHRQTKHMDGKPDWTTPAMPAGVKTHDHVAVPVNFAWDASPLEPKPVFDVRADRSLRSPVSSVVQQERAPEAHEFEEEKEHAGDPLAKQSEALRASTKDMMARLSFSSTDSFHGAGGQATHESVRPFRMTEPVHSETHEAASSGHSIAVNEPAQRVEPVNAIKKPSGTSFNHHYGQSSPSTQRHVMTPPRRRKVQFADQDRSYRGSRSQNLSDMTYHEAVRAIGATTSRDNQQSNSGARTTYQETYQWPRREHLVSVMDKVGGQTAGGPTRYEPRRVFTAEDALRVAQESALEFRPQQEAAAVPHVEVVNDNRQHGTSKESMNQSQQRSHTVTETPTSAAPIEQALTVQGSVVPTDTVQQRGAFVSVPSIRQDHEGVMDGLHAPTQSLSSRFESLENSAHFNLLHSERDAHQCTRDTGVMTTPVSVAEVSTQTDPLKKTVAVKPVEQNTLVTHKGYCSHCGRTGEPASSSGISATGQSKPSRVKRTSSSSHRYNPIFTNTRFPPEPPTFRAKTTYSSEFGSRRPFR